MQVNTLLAKSSNYTSKRSAVVKYIVIHYTANKGDTAKNNATYFHNNYVEASAHYFVDENSVWLSVPETARAWHCGGGLQGSSGHSFYKMCTNNNSIGIEMCLWDKKGNIREGTIETAIALTKELMAKYNIPADRVIRHWDVTGKQCPAPMVGNNNAYWNNFKKRIQEEEIDVEELRKLQQQITALNTQTTTEINSLRQRIKTLENAQEDVYAKFEDVPEWGKEAVQKLIDRGAFETDTLNLQFSILRLIVIMNRLGLLEEGEIVYQTLDDVPSWGKAIIEKLLDEGKLKGTSHTSLDMSFTMLRVLVILDRCGAFGDIASSEEAEAEVFATPSETANN